MLGRRVQVGDPAVLAQGEDAAGDRAHHRGVDPFQRFQALLAAQQLAARALQLLGEERRQRAHQQERGEVRRHHHRQPPRSQRNALQIAAGRRDDPALHAPDQDAERDARYRRA